MWHLDVEARRIARELVRLHKAGAIKSEQDASFYARLIRDFGASFTVRTGPVAPKPGAPNGSTVPESGKPYVPTEAQRVKVPRGLSRRQEAEFLARDLEEALAYELPPPPRPHTDQSIGLLSVLRSPNCSQLRLSGTLRGRHAAQE